MKPFHRVPGRIAVLDRVDVDTDQIIPKQFLKRIERTGYGGYLFYDWRQDPEFKLNAGGGAGRRSSSPGGISAAAPRASTPPGRCRTTDST